MEEEAPGQGMQETPGSCEGEKTDPLLEPPERKGALLTP